MNTTSIIITLIIAMALVMVFGSKGVALMAFVALAIGLIALSDRI